MSADGENRDMYGDHFSEQPGNAPVWGSTALPISRARCAAVVLAAAENAIGQRGGPGLRARVQSIVDYGREFKLSPDAYALAYFILKTIKAEHVIFNHVAIPDIPQDIV